MACAVISLGMGIDPLISLTKTNGQTLAFVQSDIPANWSIARLENFLVGFMADQTLGMAAFVHVFATNPFAGAVLLQDDAKPAPANGWWLP